MMIHCHHKQFGAQRDLTLLKVKTGLLGPTKCGLVQLAAKELFSLSVTMCAELPRIKPGKQGRTNEHGVSTFRADNPNALSSERIRRCFESLC